MPSKLATNAHFDRMEVAPPLPPALPSSHLGWPRAPTWEREKQDSHPTSTLRFRSGLFTSRFLLDSCLPFFPTPGASDLARLPSHTSSRNPGSFAEPADFARGARKEGVGLPAWHVPRTPASAFCMPRKILLYCFNGKSCSSEPQIHSFVRVVAGRIRR